jgi:L-lactate dehydrogenase complex protein LldG
MSERENILGRIRAALRTPAARPQPHRGQGPEAATGPVSVRDLLPAVGRDREENLALFHKNALELRADFRLVKDWAELLADLKQLAVTEKWSRIASHRGDLTEAACQALALPTLLADGHQDKRALEQCDAGLTECDALVAHTGSVLVTSRSAGGRALSVLPPHHVVLARREQLLPGLPDAFALLKARYDGNYPSMISFITGPSRTGDIERILVLGAHGPKKLTIYCL